MRCFLAIIPAILIVLLLGCAKQAPPPGGIEDKIGPTIVSNYPASGEVNVDRNMVVKLEFSEYVNRPTVESALFMSPDPILRLKYKWSGRTLRLIYLDPLEENRTYVVSVGSEAKDLRGNPAGATTTIAFSTGDKLDRGKFHGWIDGVEKPQTISIWAYPLESDTMPDLFTDVAEYRIQAKTDGTFHLEYLKDGNYRVFAVADQNRDGLWNPVSEMIGTASSDIEVTEFTDTWISFVPVMQDTSSMKIRRTKQIEAGRFEIKLSRPVRSLDCVFTDSVGISLSLLDACQQGEEPETWTAFLESQPHPGSWIVSCSGTDLLRREWMAFDTLDVVDKPDTTAPLLLTGWPTDYPTDAISPDSVLLTFDEPINWLDLPDTTLRITSYSETLDVQIRAHSLRSLLCTPASPIDSGGRYVLTFNGESLVDLYDNPFADSTASYSFAVLPGDSLGSIIGTLESPVGGQYILKVFDLRSDEPFDSLTLSVGPFRFDDVPSGKYLITVIQDRNRDGLLSPGSIIPFEFSEPYFQAPDTITVRARWEYETTINWNPNS